MNENFGYGAGGGLVGTILGVVGSWFGFKTKINDMEKRIDSLTKNVIYSDTFQQFEKRFEAVEDRLKDIDKKLDRLLTK